MTMPSAVATKPILVSILARNGNVSQDLFRFIDGLATKEQSSVELIARNDPSALASDIHHKQAPDQKHLHIVQGRRSRTRRHHYNSAASRRLAQLRSGGDYACNQANPPAGDNRVDPENQFDENVLLKSGQDFKQVADLKVELSQGAKDRIRAALSRLSQA